MICLFCIFQYRTEISKRVHNKREIASKISGGILLSHWNLIGCCKPGARAFEGAKIVRFLVFDWSEHWHGRAISMPRQQIRGCSYTRNFAWHLSLYNVLWDPSIPALKCMSNKRKIQKKSQTAKKIYFLENYCEISLCYQNKYVWKKN